MWNYIWPMLLIIFSNVLYNICTKETPQTAEPFLALAVTYLTSTVASVVFYLLRKGRGDIVQDVRALNWTSLLLGLTIIGLEAGYIYLYRAGWQISVGSLVANISLAVILLLIGVAFYHDSLGARQVTGIALCVTGLVFINWK